MWILLIGGYYAVIVLGIIYWGGGLTIGGLFANTICGAYIREGLLSEFYANRGFAGQFYMRLSV